MLGPLLLATQQSKTKAVSSMQAANMKQHTDVPRARATFKSKDWSHSSLRSLQHDPSSRHFCSTNTFERFLDGEMYCLEDNDSAGHNRCDQAWWYKSAHLLGCVCIDSFGSWFEGGARAVIIHSRCLGRCSFDSGAGCGHCPVLHLDEPYVR